MGGQGIKMRILKILAETLDTLEFLTDLLR